MKTEKKIDEGQKTSGLAHDASPISGAFPHDHIQNTLKY
jgi:hypothetical protein